VTENAIDRARRQILVALDVPALDAALDLVRALRGRVGGFKVGLELCTSAGVPQVVEAISAAGGEVFLDLKFKDIPNTVAGAARGAARPGVLMFNVHCDGGPAMMRAAAEAARAAPARPLVLGVTLLTSLGQAELNGPLAVSGTPEEYVLRMALLARESGLDGVVASPHEAAAIRRACGSEFAIVTPGIRPAWSAEGDQRRVTTPLEAIRAGADYVVIGRPITAPPAEIGGPAEAAERIVAEIARSLERGMTS
jgi:orotidine-5'-phosphate decarboxylase